jgi:DnaJ-class molecular chaperone
MRSIRSTNNTARRARAHAVRRANLARITKLLTVVDDDCGQCEGTGTIEGGLSGDGEDEECPVCDGTGVLPDHGD